MDDGGVRSRMDDDQRHARIFGVLFIVTFITSIRAASAGG